jgi:hypothetical protein
MDNIVPDQFEVSVGKKMTDIIFGAREKIIDTDNISSVFQKGIAEMASEKSGTSCDQDTFHRVPSWFSSKKYVENTQEWMGVKLFL